MRRSRIAVVFILALMLCMVPTQHFAGETGEKKNDLGPMWVSITDYRNTLVFFARTRCLMLM